MKLYSKGTEEVSGTSWLMTRTSSSLVSCEQSPVHGILADNRSCAACADQLIRIFSPAGKLLASIKGNTDVVRALCKVPKGHVSHADFASASNDGAIRLWTLSGRQVGELQGHESFIYSLASLPNGDLLSSGEDRTVRVWRGFQCIQTITHPAISVWSVAVCRETGDIVTGASDKIARVFTRSKDRQAEPQVIRHFEDSVKSSSIPQQQVGEIQKEKLAGPEYLQQKSGTKEGQTVMIREPDGSVTAHQWSIAASQWVKVGTVVDAEGSSGKKVDYLGNEYDYVFDVDIAEGKPPLKLPYNLSQNPYEAATKFIQDNELPMGYLDQVANFIVTNTQGATIGQSSQPAPAGSDPWGTESRYRPGDASAAQVPPPPASRPKVLPQKQYLSIKTANLKTIQKKIEELNEKLIAEGSKEIALNPSGLTTLHNLIQYLEQNPSSTAKPVSADTDGLELILGIVTTWPPAHRLPGLDVLRLLVAATPSAANYRSQDGSSVVESLEQSGVFEDKDRSNNIMLAVRVFANLFETDKGRTLAERKFEKIHELVKTASEGTTNRNLVIAVATLYVNYAVLYTSPPFSELPSAADRALELTDDLAQILASTTDSESVYRSLVAVGTLLTLGEEVQEAAKQVYDINGALKKAEQGIRESRIKGVVAEIRELLK